WCSGLHRLYPPTPNPRSPRDYDCGGVWTTRPPEGVCVKDPEVRGPVLRRPRFGFPCPPNETSPLG
ncbi:hypothetical protein P7K49_007368, partial [Saguinus oedipus]